MYVHGLYKHNYCIIIKVCTLRHVIGLSADQRIQSWLLPINVVEFVMYDFIICFASELISSWWMWELLNEAGGGGGGVVRGIIIVLGSGWADLLRACVSVQATVNCTCVFRWRERRL